MSDSRDISNYNPPNVLFIPTTNSGVQHWRMYNFALAAFRTGAMKAHHLWWQKELNDSHPWEKRITNPEFMFSITKEIDLWAHKADAIVMQMVHFESGLGLFRALREMLPNTPILAEIDDNILSIATYNEAHESYNPNSETRKLALSQFKEADGMIVSTPYLKEIYSDFNDNIWVIENSIDFDFWGKAKPRAKPGIRIGWAGGASHSEDLKILVPTIKQLVKRHKNVKFVFWHGGPMPSFIKELDGVEVHEKWAHIEKYPKALAALGCDIWLAPLRDNSFNRGKSNIRWLEGCALGLPTVASNVGHFKETIVSGVDGFLADDSDGFTLYLEHLITDKKMRKQMGKDAHKRAYDDFNVDKVVSKYADAMKSVMAIKSKKEVLA